MASRSPLPELVQGQSLGTQGGSHPHYQIDRMLGRGAAGRVYAARLPTQEICVVKIPMGWDFYVDIAMEWRFLSGKNHPNIVKLRAVDWAMMPGMDREVMFLVMDYYQTTLFADLRSKRTYSTQRAVGLTRQMAQGLQATGLLHRDLKPENVMLDAQGNAVVTDFGLALPASYYLRQKHGIPSDGLLGTALYMSPEQMLEETSIDVRSDIYALGLLLYEMVVGTPARPRRMRDEDEMDYFARIVDHPINYRYIADERVRAIVETCTATDRGQRYPDYWGLLSDLDVIVAKSH